MKKSFRHIVLLSFLGVAIGIAAAWYQVNNEAGASNVFARIEPASGAVMAGSEIGGPFTLINHQGEPVTEQNFRESYKLVFFGFTHCPEICPAELQKITTAMKALGPEGEAVQPIFISVDPERDTPAVMKDYLSAFHPRIVGLTGTREQIRAVEESYKVYAAKVEGVSPGSYTMNHSSFTFFLTPEGELIDLFSAADTPSDMVKVIMQAI